MDKQIPKNSINVVSKRTGLSQHVLRVWERRYNAITPQRTETNRRLYTDADIERLGLLQEAIKLGHSIGRIAQLPVSELRELVRSGGGALSAKFPQEPSQQNTYAPRRSPETYLRQCRDAVTRMDSKALDDALVSAHRSLSQPVMIEALITPLLVWVGEAWKNGDLRISHEHFVSNALRQFLVNIRHTSTPEVEQPVIIVTTPPGYLHELGAMLASMVAAAEGWRDMYLGPNLPVEEIANAVESAGAQAVALSLIYPHNNPHLEREMIALTRYLNPNVPVIVGGQAAFAYLEFFQRIGIIVSENIQEFRHILMCIEQGLVPPRPTNTTPPTPQESEPIDKG